MVFSFALLGVFIAVYVISFIILSVLTLRFKNTQNAISDATGKINQLKDVEAILLASQKKLSAIDEITKSEISYPAILKELLVLPPDGILIKSINVDAKGAVKLDYIASSSASLESFVNTLLEKDEIENKFASVFSNAITKAKDGRFSTSVTFNTVKDKFNE